MIILSYIGRDRLLRQNWRRVVGGFSLLEILLVLFVFATLAALLVPSVRETIERTRRDGEMRSLEEVAAAITASFENSDLSNLNVAALPGTIGPGETATVFSTTTAAPYAAAASSDWFVKVARLRGVTPQIGTAVSAQPELMRIAVNPLGNARWLYAAPAEPGRQRFLLVSLMARNEQLTVPAYEANAPWFDAIWNNDWDGRTASVPAYWNGRLSSAQLAAWSSGSGGMTETSRLCVRRIVVPKFRVTINNNHAGESAFVSFNNTANAFTAGANTGVSVTPEILAGRLVIINRGSAWPGVEALRFHLRENSTVTLQ
jgi:type II secretory pathway pseudopilin PulG